MGLYVESCFIGRKIDSCCKRCRLIGFTFQGDIDMPVATSSVPDTQGRFGPYGGRFLPETLMYALRQLTGQYENHGEDAEVQRQVHHELEHDVGGAAPWA